MADLFIYLSHYDTTELKWSRAGQLARIPDKIWSKTITKRHLGTRYRNLLCLAARRADDIPRVAGRTWLIERVTPELGRLYPAVDEVRLLMMMISCIWVLHKGASPILMH